MNAIKVLPKKASSRYVALNNNYEVIAEGETAKSVVEKAELLGVDFSLTYVPIKGQKCFY
ncbi:MAG: hypothetical protein IPO21_08090 [Bacteroidales bacterium]|nr:hypothetical protein [Bacteroidales bacterium]